VLVLGEDRVGHFAHHPPPESEWDEEGLKRHRKDMEVMAVNYVQSERRKEG
jgi:hypothetical protein